MTERVAEPVRRYTSVVLATRNAHKVSELRDILAPSGLAVVGLEAFPQAPEVAETGVTFAANALLKAVAIAEATGLPAIADDSGLCVDVLGGAPGVFSARWSGRHGDDTANLALLLAQLADVAEEHRGAHFVCAAALALPGGVNLTREGRFFGRLAFAPVGAHGFGYDPIFVPDGQSRSLAQMSPAEKNAVSHRALAFGQMLPLVIELTGASTE